MTSLTHWPHDRSVVQVNDPAPPPHRAAPPMPLPSPVINKPLPPSPDLSKQRSGSLPPPPSPHGSSSVTPPQPPAHGSGAAVPPQPPAHGSGAAVPPQPPSHGSGVSHGGGGGSSRGIREDQANRDSGSRDREMMGGQANLQATYRETGHHSQSPSVESHRARNDSHHIRENERNDSHHRDSQAGNDSHRNRSSLIEVQAKTPTDLYNIEPCKLNNKN